MTRSLGPPGRRSGPPDITPAGRPTSATAKQHDAVSIAQEEADVLLCDDLRPVGLHAWRCAVHHLADRGLPPDHVRRGW